MRRNRNARSALFNFGSVSGLKPHAGL
jgi:hypothetical protein